MARRVDLPIEELARRYEAGAPLRQLADDYRTSTGTVRDRLVEAGVDMRRREAPRREVAVAVAELVSETQAAGRYAPGARSSGWSAMAAALSAACWSPG